MAELNNETALQRHRRKAGLQALHRSRRIHALYRDFGLIRRTLRHRVRELEQSLRQARRGPDHAEIVRNNLLALRPDSPGARKVWLQEHGRKIRAAVGCGNDTYAVPMAFALRALLDEENDTFALDLRIGC